MSERKRRELAEKSRKEIETMLTKAGYRVSKITVEGAHLVVWVRVEILDDTLLGPPQ